MTILTYILAVVVVLAFCVLGLSIGLLLKRHGLRTCGRAAEEHDDDSITCPACENRGACKRK